MIPKEVEMYEPLTENERWTKRERYFLAPFFSNIDGPISVIRNLPPEIVGALCSRASRAEGSLLRVFMKEYVHPILYGEDKDLAREFKHVIAFLHRHGFKNILNNQRAQEFYAKWLAPFGDDSIGQMTGAHVTCKSISQVGMKIIEDQRVGLEPIEKSTRYVNFGKKINGKYMYYEPADLQKFGKRIVDTYRKTMDGLFDTYNALSPRLFEWLRQNFDADDRVLKAKVFDTLRGLLPMAALGQVAFRGNGQAFEYLINRTRKHALGEMRWISHAFKKELDTEIPSLLLRIESDIVKEYQYYLRDRKKTTATEVYGRIFPHLLGFDDDWDLVSSVPKPMVALVEYDPLIETKIITAILFSLPEMHLGWETLLGYVQSMRLWEKKAILEKYLGRRKARWFKVGRALENSFLRFEIVMNIGAYRDLHRHRMHTQDRQMFSVYHGYDVPQEIIDAGLEDEFRSPLEAVVPLYELLAKENAELAQYVVALAYRIRFYQYQNVQQFFWEVELRTGSQGHPDYRWIEQEKFRQFEKIASLIAPYIKVDTQEYPIARRGDTERIQKKEERIKRELLKKN